jgi:hypothetical protein
MFIQELKHQILQNYFAKFKEKIKQRLPVKKIDNRKNQLSFSEEILKFVQGFF